MNPQQGRRVGAFAEPWLLGVRLGPWLASVSPRLRWGLPVGKGSPVARAGKSLDREHSARLGRTGSAVGLLAVQLPPTCLAPRGHTHQVPSVDGEHWRGFGQFGGAAGLGLSIHMLLAI